MYLSNTDRKNKFCETVQSILDMIAVVSDLKSMCTLEIRVWIGSGTKKR